MAYVVEVESMALTAYRLRPHGSALYWIRPKLQIYYACMQHGRRLFRPPSVTYWRCRSDCRHRDAMH